MLLARSGHKVLAIDRARFPSDTISTHFMWPRTTSFLAGWGLLDKLSATGCPAIERVTADYGVVAISGRPSPVDGTAIMYSPRRTVLDLLLVQAARAAGAEIREATTFRELIWEDNRVVGVRILSGDGDYVEERARVVVGADGVWSSVARAAGAMADVHQESLTCGYYAYWSGVPTDGVEFYVRHGKDILVFPTHDHLTCIWAGRLRKRIEYVSGKRGKRVPRYHLVSPKPCRTPKLSATSIFVQRHFEAAELLSSEFRKRMGVSGRCRISSRPANRNGNWRCLFGCSPARKISQAMGWILLVG